MEYLLERIVRTPKFEENLSKIVRVLDKVPRGSLVIRGNAGSGKKTLIREAEKIVKLRTIPICTHWFKHDREAIVAIAQRLKIDTERARESTILQQIREEARQGPKVLILLSDFDELVKARPALLYNLLELVLPDLNPSIEPAKITIIGMTMNLDWAENLEKRCRSRLNADCLDIGWPYANVSEYLEFAKKLLGVDSFEDQFAARLARVYQLSGSPSIREMKRFLSNNVEMDEDGRMIFDVNPPLRSTSPSYDRSQELCKRLSNLTRDQLDLLKLSVNYCALTNKTNFKRDDCNNTH